MIGGHGCGAVEDKHSSKAKKGWEDMAEINNREGFSVHIFSLVLLVRRTPGGFIMPKALPASAFQVTERVLCPCTLPETLRAVEGGALSSPRSRHQGP